MKMVQKLSLLTLAILVAGCNEKVSPELQSSSATTPDSTTPVAPDEYYFRIANTSPLILNYKLHKTGDTNTTAACEIKNTTGLSSDIFRGNQAANDITCYFDAEELSLFNNGLNYQIEASANTCDYVAYTPFSFYDDIPGDSSDTFTQVTCANETTNSSQVALAATADGVDLSSSTTDAGCNEWISESIVPGTRVKFRPASDEQLCRFNHVDGSGSRCDIGVITVNEYVVTYTPPGDDPATQPEIRKSEFRTRVVDCGGEIGNCVKGPIEELATYTPGAVSATEISQPTINKPFTLEYKLPKLIGTYGSSKRYANFRRDLASTQIDYVSADDSAPTYAAYKSAFGIAAFGKTFTPTLIDYYAGNKKMDGTPLVTAADILAQSTPGNRYRSVPLAADPFLGLAGKISPFYSFYCLDNAFDIKARVRMVVRDWDRIFPTSADNEYLSDIWRGANSRQDNPGYVEIPGDDDIFIPFNDAGDWDDKVPMTRTSGAFDPTSTIWEPVSGFFSFSNFPRSSY